MAKKTRLWKRLLWGVGGVLGALVIVALGCLFVLEHGIPFVEGDRVVRSGAAYGFTIGSSRAEAFAAIKQNYSSPGNTVYVAWKRASADNDALRPFENPVSRQMSGDAYGYYRAAVSGLSVAPRPLLMVDQWRIEMPAKWVNDVDLTFHGDRLAEIQRSRWVFERP